MVTGVVGNFDMEMRKEDEQQLDAVRFAAGVAVLMACLEVSFFERWRVLVFIALNLLLLAILFTSSKYQTCPSSVTSRIEAVVLGSNLDEKEQTSTKEMEMQQCITSSDPEKTFNQKDVLEMVTEKGDSEESEEEDDDDDYKKSINGLSKEELNEKVEAFIAMFRQQYLVSDQPKFTRRSRTQSFVLPADHIITVPSRISSV